MGNFRGEIEVSAVIVLENIPGDTLEEAYQAISGDVLLEARVRSTLRGESSLWEEESPGDIDRIARVQVDGIRVMADDGVHVGELYRVASE